MRTLPASRRYAAAAAIAGAAMFGPVQALADAGWLAWWQTPISGSATHHIEMTVAWHARLMVLAWGILIPAATLVARFFKVTPLQRWPERLDNKFWWHTHVRLQTIAVAVAAFAIVPVWGSRSEPLLSQVHRGFAWAACALAVAQIVGGALRGSKGGPTDRTLRGDHYDMTARRVVFEYVHKLGGYAAIACAAVAIVTGLILVDAPRWMAIAIAGWWLVCCLAFAWLQHRGWCIDTYQAIWGPGEEHPGNHRRPIGVGVRRYQEARAPLWPGHRPPGMASRQQRPTTTR